MISNVFSSSPQLNLNSDEKDKLFLTYILSQINEMHYQKIFDTYREYNREKPIQVTTYLDLYNYFSERKTLFSIDVNGFVKLNAQFMVGQNSKILPISGLMNSEVSKFPVLNSASSETRQIIEQLQFPKILSSTCNSYQVENDVLCHSNSFELLRIHIKESLIFLNSQFDDLPHACGVATVIHILKDLQTLNHSDYEKISLMFDINVNLLRNSSATILCQLSEEEKDLMIITCTLIKSGVLHFTKLFQELKKT
ncbi:uncharacterized protein CEXT_235751 [Caerostris extrusa]|uniref:Uncharacterized protein n=1 Tax=Caerostris extrusa TaxID=172846 RepID=A0AAV4N4S0_CAEEX|nr:uncharacterized protein CEXT_235751 [Caerostris extrusa]